ncbi:MAG: insulinase family protein [Firmicutes bacterium]|nr:insulinase family protein [Bacillota bacterium]
MLSRIALSALMGATVLSAQTIPDRPEKIAVKPITFQVPKVKDARIKLKNGITAYLVPDPAGQPLVNLTLLIKGGSYLDPAGKEGASLLMGQLLRTGGTTKTPAEKLDEKVDFLAANLSSGMGETSANLNLNILGSKLNEGLGLLMEVLTEPTFQQDRLDLAKKNVRQQIERRNDDTTSIERYQQGLLVRGEKHYTNRFTTAASLEAITRDDLKALHARLLTPANLAVAVSGNFDRKAMEKLLNETLGSLKAGKDAKASPKVPAPEHTLQPGIYVCEKDVNQGRVTLSFPGLRQIDADWPAVTVMNHILGGGGFTSRMMKKIRSDEGLAYSVGSYFSPGPFYQGTFTDLFQTKVPTVAYGIRLALAEMERIKKEPVTEEELKVTKGAIIDGFPDTFGTKAVVAQVFLNMENTGLPETYYETLRDRINAVTIADVQRVAQKYLTPEKAAILVVGGKAADLEAGDKDHPGKLSEVAKLPVVKLPLRDPLTMKVVK